MEDMEGMEESIHCDDLDQQVNVRSHRKYHKSVKRGTPVSNCITEGSNQ